MHSKHKKKKLFHGLPQNSTIGGMSPEKNDMLIDPRPIPTFEALGFKGNPSATHYIPKIDNTPIPRSSHKKPNVRGKTTVI